MGMELRRLLLSNFRGFGRDLVANGAYARYFFEYCSTYPTTWPRSLLKYRTHFRQNEVQDRDALSRSSTLLFISIYPFRPRVYYNDQAECMRFLKTSDPPEKGNNPNSIQPRSQPRISPPS